MVRTKSNVLLQRRYSRSVEKTTGVRSDHTVILTAIGSAKAYPDALRRISYLDVTTAMIWHLQLQRDADCHKEIQIGSQRFQRYSQKAIINIKEAAAHLDLADVWKKYKGRNQPKPIPPPPGAVVLEDTRTTA